MPSIVYTPGTRSFGAAVDGENTIPSRCHPGPDERSTRRHREHRPQEARGAEGGKPDKAAEGGKPGNTPDTAKTKKKAEGGKPGETLDTAKTKKKAEGGKPDQKWIRRLIDWDTGLAVMVECDPQLEPQAQAERFFQLARRRQRRIEEAESRARTFGEAARGLEKALAQAPAAPDWASLHRLEQLAGAAPKAPLPTGGGGKNKAAGAWLGKRFASKDGMAILVGRSKDENLELTFKVARGNDVWLHVRGRPGAHGLIPLTSGKSAPLDTLLDAAVLTLYYSGGEHWGKTEVDYTFKKYVKRIKDSTEASYTNNKTLIVEVDPSRLKRLMATQDV
jgi:predicted ribosome quality control (RQC) complex YloA/Tae2 family protein